jgi:microcystin-dependent protein
VPLCAGQGPGLSTYIQGQAIGSESIALLGGNTPPHNHTIAFSTATGTSASPKAAGQLAVGVADTTKTALTGFYSDKPATVSLKAGTIQPATGGQPHENRQQFLTLNYIIATAGVYPSQG